VARSLGAIWPQALVMLALLAGTLWALRRKPWLGFLGAWFFLILTPSSSVLPIITEVAAERRMYLSLIPVLVLVVLGVSAALRWTARRFGWSARLRRATAAGLAILAAGAGTCATAARNLDYRSDEQIWRAVLHAWPNSQAARFSLAGALYDQGRVEEGMAMLRDLLRLAPDYSKAHYHLAFGFVRLNRLPEAAAEYAQAVALAPDDHKARLNYAGVLAMLGRYIEARHEIEASLRISPNQPFAYFQLGRVDEAEGRLADAAEHYRAGLELAPGDAAGHSRLGGVLARLGRTAEARTHLVEALRLEPSLAEARAALASLDIPVFDGSSPASGPAPSAQR
jgi:tetratricopeptide (TPR) repeat protein